MAEPKRQSTGQQYDNTLLIRLVESVAVLTSKFDSFEKVRSEDNVELKEAIEKVDLKVDKLDAKFEARQATHDKDIEALRTSINDLQKAPLNDKAKKWESISKLVIETIIAAALVVILAQIGLK